MHAWGGMESRICKSELFIALLLETRSWNSLTLIVRETSDRCRGTENKCYRGKRGQQARYERTDGIELLLIHFTILGSPLEKEVFLCSFFGGNL